MQIYCLVMQNSVEDVTCIVLPLNEDKSKVDCLLTVNVSCTFEQLRIYLRLIVIKYRGEIMYSTLKNLNKPLMLLLLFKSAGT